MFMSLGIIFSSSFSSSYGNGGEEEEEEEEGEGAWHGSSNSYKIHEKGKARSQFPSWRHKKAYPKPRRDLTIIM